MSFFDQDSDSEYGMDWMDREDDYNVFEENQLANDREFEEDHWDEEEPFDDWREGIDDVESYVVYGPDE